jgi:hypothetical protein
VDNNKTRVTVAGDVKLATAPSRPTNPIWTNAGTIVPTVAAGERVAKITQLSGSGNEFEIAEGAAVNLTGSTTNFAAGALELRSAAGEAGGKLTGEGTLIAGKTEISGGTGGWKAVGLSNDATAPAVNGYVTIASGLVDGNIGNGRQSNILSTPATAAAAAVAAGDTWAGGVLTAGVGAGITQLTGADNDLTIGTGTSIDLKGEIATRKNVGKIILTAGQNEPGKIVFFNSSSQIIIDGSAREAGGIDVGTSTETPIFLLKHEDPNTGSTRRSGLITCNETVESPLSGIRVVKLIYGKNASTKVAVIIGVDTTPKATLAGWEGVIGSPAASGVIDATQERQ